MMPLTMSVKPQAWGGIKPEEEGFLTINHVGFGSDFGSMYDFDMDQAIARITDDVPEDADYAWLDIEYPLPDMYEIGDDQRMADLRLGSLLWYASRYRPNTSWSIYGWPTNRGWTNLMGDEWRAAQSVCYFIRWFIHWFCVSCYVGKVKPVWFEGPERAVDLALEFTYGLAEEHGPKPVIPVFCHRAHNGGWQNPDGFKLHDPDALGAWVASMRARGVASVAWWGADRWYFTSSVRASAIDPSRYFYTGPNWDRVRLRGIEEGVLPADVTPGYAIPDDVLGERLRTTWEAYAPIFKEGAE